MYTCGVAQSFLAYDFIVLGDFRHMIFVVLGNFCDSMILFFACGGTIMAYKSFVI